MGGEVKFESGIIGRIGIPLSSSRESSFINICNLLQNLRWIRNVMSLSWYRELNQQKEKSHDKQQSGGSFLFCVEDVLGLTLPGCVRRIADGKLVPSFSYESNLISESHSVNSLAKPQDYCLSQLAEMRFHISLPSIEPFAEQHTKCVRIFAIYSSSVDYSIVWFYARLTIGERKAEGNSEENFRLRNMSPSVVVANIQCRNHWRKALSL